MPRGARRDDGQRQDDDRTAALGEYGMAAGRQRRAAPAPVRDDAGGAARDAGGVDELRQAEDEALVAGLQLPPPHIVDAAGGTILSDSSRRLLEKSLVVWLRASPETLFRRAKNAPHRPWLDRGDEWVREAAAHRYPLYGSVADLIVDTDVGKPPLAVAEIMAWLRGVAPCAAFLPPVQPLLDRS